MALMQANNIPGQKRMMSPLGQGHRPSPESHQPHSQHSHNQHGHQVHHQQPHQSHMGHPSAGSCPPLLIRKDGDYHSSRLADGKDMQANQNMQPKKKHKKAGSSSKVKVEHFIPTMEMDDDDSSLKVQKNFICDHCYGAFRSSYHLKRHILTHTELLTDRQAAETPAAMYSGDEQRGEPVRTGSICPYSFLEPPTAFQQPPDCLTPAPHRDPTDSSLQLSNVAHWSSTVLHKVDGLIHSIYVPQPGTLLQTPGGGALALVSLALAVALKNKEPTAWQL
ncbi:Zinc finger protein 740 [Dissostichus eleginoides]|uniref:Zinc finger protein 740 n=1 Tax=Dissostichus eleginoides TaxID=100907 RepID=A0AAD9FD13_DISEL|nr:Zinc finger protein 740 [Dissostichus eleginoides]